MMYSRRIPLCLFAIAVAPGSITESIDHSASGFVEPSDLLNSNDPMFNPDTLNLLVYNSENVAVIPESYKTNPVSDSDRLNGLAYSSENLNDLSNSLMGSETDSNGPSSNSDAPNSESLESSRIVVPDLNGPDLFHLDSPISSAPADKTESDGGLTSNRNHNLESLRGACISDNRAASRDKGNGGTCINPRTEYHKKKGHSGGAHETDDQDRKDIEIRAKEDAIWKAREFYAGRNPQTTEQIQKKCESIGDYYEIRIVAVCCLGPSHFLVLQFENGQSFYITNEEHCDFNWSNRPICLGDDGLIDPENAFCCEHLGERSMWGLFWGMNCIRMDALSDAVWN